MMTLTHAKPLLDYNLVDIIDQPLNTNIHIDIDIYVCARNILMMQYMQHIRMVYAPVCMKVKLTFSEFQIFPAETFFVNGSLTTACWYDGLEITLNDTLEGIGMYASVW